ncbi:unnamed protein product [Nezara viridula]|uniref:Uncharacterized protein n=1 Tax=Nezara viridula TaxID=85310 RepID=A0A9P0HIZ1_NEZVI|nr:unnamed protein product [Nezara viridula]
MSCAMDLQTKKELRDEVLRKDKNCLENIPCFHTKKWRPSPTTKITERSWAMSPLRTQRFIGDAAKKR